MNTRIPLSQLFNRYLHRLLKKNQLKQNKLGRNPHSSSAPFKGNLQALSKNVNKKTSQDKTSASNNPPATTKRTSPAVNTASSSSPRAKASKKPQLSDQTIGDRAELAALNFLVAEGLNKLDTNYHSRCGEIDIVMADNRAIVFVEVRYRKHASFGSGAMTVTANKQKKLIKTANYYLQQHQANVECRFDVIEMSPAKDDKFHIHWIKNAFM